MNVGRSVFTPHFFLDTETRIPFLGTVSGLTKGSFCVKSTKILKIGRGHGSDFVHILFLNTLGHTKTTPEVIGPRLTWFGNYGRLKFLPQGGAILGLFFVCLYYDNFMIFIHPN